MFLSSLFLLLYHPKNVSLMIICKTRSTNYPETMKSRFQHYIISKANNLTKTYKNSHSIHVLTENKK